MLHEKSSRASAGNGPFKSALILHPEYTLRHPGYTLQHPEYTFLLTGYYATATATGTTPTTTTIPILKKNNN